MHCGLMQLLYQSTYKVENLLKEYKWESQSIMWTHSSHLHTAHHGVDIRIIDQEVAARLHSLVRASSPPPSQNITFIGGVAVTTPSLYNQREAAARAGNMVRITQ